MNIVNGAQLRTRVNLNLRTKPSVTAPRIVTLQTGVLVQALAAPANGWLYCVVHGWRDNTHPDHLVSDPNTKSSVDARRGADPWRSVSIEGYASMGNPAWWVVVDGPQEAT